ncbi:MAG TPA: thiamine phosphate synthase [Planctomycetota bacterium]|nr:thiamine phosphate synthase [Planctomycetota bacterium]
MEARLCRELLGEARIMLVFTPALCGARDPLDVLKSVLPLVDVLQVRPKEPGQVTPTTARDALHWCLAVLEVVNSAPRPVPVLVNDRVDVAASLAAEGLAGVHLGQEDMPAAEAREFLGPEALIGLSTHSMSQVVIGGELPVDYLGLGPVFDSSTKPATDQRRTLSPETYWVAQEGCPSQPIFPIGGITSTNVADLHPVTRCAVAGSILGAADPPAAAGALRAALLGASGAD